jgi:methylglutaconyl-CoA hydratase
MAVSPVQTERGHSGCLLLTLNRPEKRNALNLALLKAMTEAVEAVGSDPEIRSIIIRGAGPVFCAGLDLHESSDPESAEKAAETVGRMLTAVHNSPKVTIAAVQGAAIAGGAGLMTCCDFVIATPDARFGYPEVRRGLVAALVMPYLVRRAGEANARELLLLADTVNADRALAMGLVNRVVPEAALLEEAMAVARAVAQGAPGAIAATKRLLDDLQPRPVTEHVERALAAHREARASGEAAEGIAAFLEKRPPTWHPTAQPTP